MPPGRSAPRPDDGRRRAGRRSGRARQGREGPPRERGAWRFAGAAAEVTALPHLGLPEIAFAGRSNVGKSSLINELTRTPSLARTSATPGRTQQINFFELPGTVAFADLPGYGFARVPERVRAAWKPLVEGYLASRETLRAVVLIIDPRRGIETDDRRLLAFLDGCGRPTVVVASKVDKLGRADLERAIAEITLVVPEVVSFSARSGEGQRQLWRRLATLAALR